VHGDIVPLLLAVRDECLSENSKQASYRTVVTCRQKYKVTLKTRSTSRYIRRERVHTYNPRLTQEGAERSLPRRRRANVSARHQPIGVQRYATAELNVAEEFYVACTQPSTQLNCRPMIASSYPNTNCTPCAAAYVQ